MLQIVGADEIVGYDELEDDDDVEGMLGASPASALARLRGRAVRSVAKKRTPVRVASREFAVQTAQPKNAQTMVLGIESNGTVAAAASAVITFKAQVLFRGRRLLIPDAIAAAFTVDDIKIGNASQFAASGAVPASAFGESVNGAGTDNLVMGTAQVSQDIVMTVTNRSLAAVQFRAALFGDAVY